MFEKIHTMIRKTIFNEALEIKRTCMVINSAIGPDITIPIGETKVAIVMTLDITLPCLSGGITVWRIVRNIVLTKGTMNANMKPPRAITMKL